MTTRCFQEAAPDEGAASFLSGWVVAVRHRQECQAINGLTLPTAQARILSLHAGLAGTASGLASAITMIGAGGIAFAAGFLIETPNARLAALIAMLAASLVSLAAVACIAGMEGTRGQCA